MVKGKVLWAFIKSVGTPMLLITLASVYFAIAYRSSSPVFLFFWFKLIVDALLFYFWMQFRGQEIFYYYNLGFRRRVLFAATAILDLGIFTLLHIIINIWR